MAARASDPRSVWHGGRRRRLLAAVGCVAVCAATAACEPGTPRGAPPTRAQLIAAVQEQVKARAAAMREQPAAAAAEAGLLAESLAPLAEKPGSPFDGLLGTVKEIQASLGPRPSPKAVQEAAARLTDEAAKLAP